MRTVLVLGSTGSVGTQTLELLAANPDKFQLVGISGNSNIELLESQRVQFGLSKERAVLGPELAADLAGELSADVVVNGITGSAGLMATLSALRAGSKLALADSWWVAGYSACGERSNLARRLRALGNRSVLNGRSKI